LNVKPLCILCQGREFAPKYGFPHKKYVICTQCGLSQVSPYPDKAEMAQRAEFWARNYHTSEQKIRQVYDPKFQKVAYTPYLNLIRGKEPAGKLLDVGCGSGGFLDAARQQGWDVYGVDISSSIEIPKAHGIQTWQAELAELALMRILLMPSPCLMSSNTCRTPSN